MSVAARKVWHQSINAQFALRKPSLDALAPAPANDNRAGRIAAAAKGGLAQGAYTYDAFERLRVRTLSNQTPAANNGTTHYVWDISGRIIAEANGATGASLRETVYLDGMPLAAIDAAAVPKKTYTVHVDHLHRPILMTDAAKASVWSAAYEPFGRASSITGPATQNLGLPGQWFQLETGLAYNWHRHYDPTTGRYTTADPLGFVDGPSVYAYAGNNPHRWVDERGLIVGAGASGALGGQTFGSAELCVFPRRTDPCRGLRIQLALHEAKLAAYRENPQASDNLGKLGVSPESDTRIIQGRIRELEGQIENFRRMIKQRCGA